MYIGQPVRRKEDFRFLTGRGRYVADIKIPGAAHAAFVRSPHAHARIRSISTSVAGKMPGVLRILTGADWKRENLGVSPVLWIVTSSDGKPMHSAARPILATERVRFVGDTVALVIAATQEQAQSAAESIDIDYDPLAATVTAEDSLRAGAPLVHEQFRTNMSFDWEIGNRDSTNAVFANADHVTRLTLVNNRLAPCPLEPRAVIGNYDSATDQYTLWSTTQNPHLVRNWLAEHSLFVPEHKMRVVAPDVGGGFGQKIYHYPEEPTVLWASRLVGRPVRWTSTRSENLMVDTHARDHVTECSLALDSNGMFLALQADTLANLGAYMSPFASCIPTYFYAPMLSELYKIPSIYCRVRGFYSHTTPIDAYRGAGRPEALLVVERLIENAAHELGIDPADIREKNFIQPDEFPYTTATMCKYDSGNYPGLMQKTKEMGNYEALRREQKQLREKGVILGIGISAFADCAGATTE